MKLKALGICAALLALGVPVDAQAMEQGTWTGMLSPPGGEGVPVTYVVGVSGGALSIVMNNAQLGDIPFSDERLDADELTFWWEPGTRVECTLLRQNDRSFEGTCTAPNGDGVLTMVPPGA
jgi:hypothetical protein